MNGAIETALVPLQPPTPTNVHALQALERDRQTWEALVSRHDLAVRLALIARGVRADRARDFSQAAWAKLWQRQTEGRLPRLELPGLAIRQALFLVFEEGRSRREELDDGGASEPAEAGLEARLASREQLAQIRDELDRCPAKMREVFLLTHSGEGLSHAEVAERAGLSVQRVRQTLCELRARLRALLEDRS